MAKKIAIIIGAGPGGLTAAYELLARSDVHPIVLERSHYMGGIARTINYKGNRLDLGGHRFYSKSDRVMQWWTSHMPVGSPEEADKTDLRFLVRQRKSRIYFLRKFFDYPVQPTWKTLRNFGFLRAIRIMASYLRSALFPTRPINNLEDFFINRFGRELYLTFFKSYTEKVWGVPCSQIKAEWGVQRIKKISIGAALAHFLQKGTKKPHQDLSQKGTETSLIDQFIYPKLGSGQMWDEVARKIVATGGEILTGMEVNELAMRDGRVTSLSATDADGRVHQYEGDYFFSTTSIKELVHAMGSAVPAEVREVAAGLLYRDFITVGVLVKKLKLREPGVIPGQLIRDNWIYIHEKDVLVGRLQIFNNWSPFLVADPSQVWLGVEYFCQQDDVLWQKSDQDLAQLAVEELVKIGVIDKDQLLDSTVARMPKAYPAYFGAYEKFSIIRKYLDRIENLFLIGRNGMHKYNNMDHSMLTAMTAVDNICNGRKDKDSIWSVNTEEEYLETKK
jgi:protoporphyrinogen oxidase